MIENIDDLVKQISHGVYIIGVTDGIHQNAFTAAWVMQASFKPPLLALSINPEHYSYQLLLKGGVCTINVLAQNQYAIAEHFGHSAKDKMVGFKCGLFCKILFYTDKIDIFGGRTGIRTPDTLL